MKTDLLELRKNMKKRKPSFIRQDAHKKAKLGKRWKKPRGLQSKLRIGFKDYGNKVEIGYKFPKLTRGLSKNGLILKRIFRFEDLANINNQTDEIIIAKALGDKKRIEIIKESIKLNIKIYNIKDAESYIKKIGKKRNEKKDGKVKEANKERRKDIKKIGKKVQESISEEEKKREEKKEKDKILTKKE